MPLVGRGLYWAYITAAIAFVAALLRFGHYARGTAATVAEILFYICLAVILVLLVRHFMRRGSGPAA